MHHSIRRRLPLSYAAIALLAALALGAVLLLTLRSHYLRVEREYLGSNAQAIAFSLAPLLEDDQPVEALQAQADSFAFLSQTHVQILDTEEQLLASSRLLGRYRVALAGSRGRELPDRERLPGAETEGGRFPVFIEVGSPLSLTIITRLEASERLPSEGGRWLTLPEGSFRRMISPLQGEISPVGGEAILDRSASSQAVTTDIRGSDGQLLGYVELSEGPAYAEEIVNDVAQGWSIASAVAVALAAAIGWLISRRMSGPLLALTSTTAAMAGGDLSARADVSRRDELGDLARSFNQMAAQVEETVLTLRRFVSDAAHEIHTPLTALYTNLELAREDVGNINVEHVEQAQAQVQRLEALSSDLLDLSHIEAGYPAQAAEPVSLVPLLQELSELHASRAEQAGLTFRLSLPESPLIVLGDAAQLERALHNLLDNGLKFTPEGGSVELGLQRDRQQDQEVARLWVQDSGIGIPEEDLPDLFQRFHRGRNASSYPGSGLGLAIVKAIVENHGGQVHAESTDDGARLTMVLPLA